MSGGYDRYADDDHIFVINPDGTSRIRNALCVALQINATF